MLKRFAVLFAVVGLGSVLVVPANAAAPKPKTKSLSLSFTAAPLTPVANTDAGVISGSLGKGAIVIVGATSGRVTAYYAGGSLTGTFKLTVTPNPDNSATYTGTTTLTSGTGAYAGAKGNAKVSGAIAVDGTVTGQVKGTITY
jgi:hypothetical protein